MYAWRSQTLLRAGEIGLAMRYYSFADSASLVSQSFRKGENDSDDQLRPMATSKIISESIHLYIRAGTEAIVEELNTDCHFSARHPAGRCAGVER